MCKDKAVSENNVHTREKTFTKGRNYLIYLLSARDYTIKEVSDKLKKADYSDDVINEVLQYGIERRYLDDERYAQDYIRLKKAGKSIRQLKFQLSQKGISSSILEQLNESDEREDLEDKIICYRERKTGSDYEKDAKTYQYFIRKGYNSSLIKDILRDVSHK